jgi:hypothetical protein
MNAVPRKQVLNEAFKQVQRLPDWPLVKTSDAKRLAQDDNEEKRQARAEGECACLANALAGRTESPS